MIPKCCSVSRSQFNPALSRAQSQAGDRRAKYAIPWINIHAKVTLDVRNGTRLGFAGNEDCPTQEGAYQCDHCWGTWENLHPFNHSQPNTRPQTHAPKHTPPKHTPPNTRSQIQAPKYRSPNTGGQLRPVHLPWSNSPGPSGTVREKQPLKTLYVVAPTQSTSCMVPHSCTKRNHWCPLPAA